MEPVADTIRTIPIFSGLSREDTAKVLGKMEETSVCRRDNDFSQGDQGDAFYLIQSGAVQVMLGKQPPASRKSSRCSARRTRSGKWRCLPASHVQRRSSP